MKKREFISDIRTIFKSLVIKCKIRFSLPRVSDASDDDFQDSFLCLPSITVIVEPFAARQNSNEVLVQHSHGIR